MQKKINLKVVIAVAAVVIIAVLMIVLWKTTREKPVEGSKTITLEVIKAEDDKKDITVKTDAEYLGEALIAEKIVEGDEGAYGLFVTSVDGREADDSAHEWWKFSKDGVDLVESISTTVIADGDHYEAILSLY